MTTTVSDQQLREFLVRELPVVLEQDDDVRRLVTLLGAQQFADKHETESRFDRVLDELRRDREENTRKWEENTRKWDESVRKWDESARRQDEVLAALRDHDRRWQENARKWDESVRKWEENDRKWDEYHWQLDEMLKAIQAQAQKHDRRWDENQRQLDEMLKAIQAQARKHDASIGALGARWGLYSEASFRNGLKAILEESFGVEVLNVVEYDDQGEVFGRPDQVELDILVRDGVLILCELKSSLSKPDVHAFHRKSQFYEKRHQRQTDRRLVISPMVAPLALKVAQELGIEVYSSALDVEPEGPPAQP